MRGPWPALLGGLFAGVPGAARAAITPDCDRVWLTQRARRHQEQTPSIVGKPDVTESPDSTSAARRKPLRPTPTPPLLQRARPRTRRRPSSPSAHWPIRPLPCPRSTSIVLPVQLSGVGRWRNYWVSGLEPPEPRTLRPRCVTPAVPAPHVWPCGLWPSLVCAGVVLVWLPGQ